MSSGLWHIFTMVLFSWVFSQSLLAGDLKILISLGMIHVSHFPIVSLLFGVRSERSGECFLIIVLFEKKNTGQ